MIPMYNISLISALILVWTVQIQPSAVWAWRGWTGDLLDETCTATAYKKLKNKQINK